MLGEFSEVLLFGNLVGNVAYARGRFYLILWICAVYPREVGRMYRRGCFYFLHFAGCLILRTQGLVYVFGMSRLGVLDVDR